MLPRILGAISIAISAFAAWIGFVPLDIERFNRKQWENRLKEWTNRIFKRLHWEWPVNTPYALTKILLGIAALLGILSIFLPS
jgi:hypothetical protein